MKSLSKYDVSIFLLSLVKLCLLVGLKLFFSCLALFVKRSICLRSLTFLTANCMLADVVRHIIIPTYFSISQQSFKNNINPIKEANASISTLVEQMDYLLHGNLLYE